MKPVRRTASKNLLGILFPASVLLAALSCDSTATLYLSEVKWDELVVLASNPMKKGVGSDGGTVYEPLCRNDGQDPVGVLFNVLFQGTQKKDSDDLDQSIKPGDYVSSNEVLESRVTPNLFEWSLTCMEELPDDAPETCDAKITGEQLPVQKVDFWRYGMVEYNPAGSVAVAVLIDMSGSMKGLVNPYPPFNEDTFANVTAALPPEFDFSVNASDPGGSRITAVQSLINTLNADDNLIVFSFNENLVDVVCELPDQEQPDLDTKMKECCGTNRSLVVGTSDFGSPLSKLKGNEKGRSPLWHAVGVAYDYMKSSDCAGDADFKHILVVTDGPDTCSPSSDMNQCSGTCLAYNTDFATVRAKIEADAFDARIPVSFVQMEAKGYGQRDARQMEMACLTGGQYVWVNSKVGSDLLNAMSTVLHRIRYTFRGYWRFAVELSTMAAGNKPEPGYLYALEGGGSVATGTDNVFAIKGEEKFDFDYNTDDNIKFWDRRVAVRKECAPGGAGCPADEKFGECASRTWWCDEDALVCRSAQIWDPNGTSATCNPVNGKLIVRVQTSTANGTTTEDKIKVLPSLPTVCCHGTCTPPKPPVVPENVSKPEGAGMACFYYEDMLGWVKETPDDPNSDWVYYATLKQSELCTLATLEPYLSYTTVPTVADFPAAWECDEAQENCYPPPGAGDGQ